MDNSAEHYLRKEIQEAVRLMDLQRNRVCYRMDEQLKTQREISEFIKNHG